MCLLRVMTFDLHRDLISGTKYLYMNTFNSEPYLLHFLEDSFHFTHTRSPLFVDVSFGVMTFDLHIDLISGTKHLYTGSFNSRAYLLHFFGDFFHIIHTTSLGVVDVPFEGHDL